MLAADFTSARRGISPTLLAAGLFLLATVYPAQYEVLEKDRIAVFYMGPDKAYARKSLGILLDARARIARLLGLRSDIPAAVMLVPREEMFNAEVGTARGHLRLLGVAYSPRGYILINLAQLSISRENPLAETLTHELVHVMLGAYERRYKVRLPRWFHEGVACHFSRIFPRSPFDQRLALAANQRILIPLELLDAQFPAYAQDTEIAYLESEDFIQFIFRKHGPAALRRVLAALAKEKDFKRAFKTALGTTVKDEEARWLESLRSPFPMLWVIWNSMDILTIGAFLTIIAYIAYRLRRAKIMAKWREEEKMEEQAGHDQSGPLI